MTTNNEKIESEISSIEIFRPIESSNVVTDNFGHEWRQITAQGFQRKCDEFFWPADPRNTDNPYMRLPPTVEEVEICRNKTFSR